MNKHALYHITDIPYSYAINEDTLLLRLRAARNDLKSCEVYYKDRYDWENPFYNKSMVAKMCDGLFDYFETELKVIEKRFRYYFKIEDVKGNIYYYNERGVHEKLGEVLEPGCFQFPFICEADIYKTPTWFKESIVYQVFPDRFCNGNKLNDVEGVLPWGEAVTKTSMFGGDLQGMIDKLDYLSELGINLIYITPIFLSTSNHKYNTCDYYKVDPSFGDIEKAKELVIKCHELGIRVVFDAVFNHSGSDFFAFKDVVEKGEASKYKDWFFINSYPVNTEEVNYITFAQDCSNMPKLNTNNVEVRKYLLEVGQFWINEVNIDGWRLDVCDEVDHSFWREFRKIVKTANPEALIIGEIMHESTSWMRGDQFDGFMNYPLREAMLDFFAKGKITAKKFQEEIVSNYVLYMDEINRNLFNLIGSHDTPRYLTECKGDIEKFKLTVAFQYTYVGIPYIYYGDEVGVIGEQDPYCRACMIWEEDKQNIELLNFYKMMNRIRKNNKALVYGKYVSLYNIDNVLIYKRTFNKEEVLVILNNNASTYKLKLKSINGNYVDLINDKPIIINESIMLKDNDILILKNII